MGWVQPSWANLQDDRFDGNIFALYAGNGSLVPPRVTLKESLAHPERPALLVYYLDDSRDCKVFASTISQVQRFYGRAIDIIPITVDSLLATEQPDPANPMTYYRGRVPQVVILAGKDGENHILLDEIGQVSFNRIDAVLADWFGIPPRQPVPVVPRQFNEVNVELAPS
ncbi:MAG: thylakoid membrane photosystem I accumulation factor [Gloeomargarita sp. SKYB31]|nr:thylakoid membrane photosystem I accumulation factor [Gloeomargarita sp. SKYB31]